MEEKIIEMVLEITIECVDTLITVQSKEQHGTIAL